MIKKIVFSLFACLLLTSLIVAGGCTGGSANTIKIGVIGPMQYLEGEHHWFGATMARDEINDAGGITIAGVKYKIKLIKADSNEVNSPTDAAAAMDRLITVDKAQFVVGGFRTEGVIPMIEEAMDNKTIFLGCGAATQSLCQKAVGDGYARYKYWFRVTPFSSDKLVANSLAALSNAATIMATELGIPKIKVAILAEQATWADAMVTAYQAYVPKYGLEVVGVWRPSGTATDVTAELTAIENSGAHIILTILSGAVGIPYSRQLGELEIPVASVGINVESQKDTFWKDTKEFGEYETTLNTYAKGVALSPKTIAFFDAFVKKNGETPTYCAGTYDAIYVLKAAIERAGTVDSDAVVTALEQTDYVGTGGRIVFTSKDSTQPHDVTYGPGYVTGIATQWINGEMKCVWPWNWGPNKDITYAGTVEWQIPKRVLDYYKK
jgi:branched-chain amino acid transport system substrate-binding protein